MKSFKSITTPSPIPDDEAFREMLVKRKKFYGITAVIVTAALFVMACIGEKLQLPDKISDIICVIGFVLLFACFTGFITAIRALELPDEFSRLKCSEYGLEADNTSNNPNNTTPTENRSRIYNKRFHM
jgi:hypothetical protein